MNKRIFFTGGSGFVGQSSIPKLIEAGYEVYALARSSTSAALVRQIGATPIQDDLTNLSKNKSVPRNVTVSQMSILTLY